MRHCYDYALSHVRRYTPPSPSSHRTARACGHLVNDRMEPSGIRWTTAGAQAVLDLWAVRLNGHWDVYWPFHRSNSMNGCTVGPPKPKHWQKPEYCSGLPDQPAIHEFWSHSFHSATL